MPSVYLETTIPSYLTAWRSPELVMTPLPLRRLEVLEGIPLLGPHDDTQALVEVLIRDLSLPDRAAADAVHIALSVVNGMDFLLTWNCTHIANAAFRPVIESACKSLGYKLPVICTPEELMMV